MWEKRDAEWARESKARERLMREVCLSVYDLRIVPHIKIYLIILFYFCTLMNNFYVVF